MSTRHLIIDIDNNAHYATQAGLLWVYGDKSVAAAPTLLADAERIPDFGRNLKRPAAIRNRLQHLGYSCEARFDAAHGRRYVLLAYRDNTERRIVMAAADGIANLRQHHIDSGCDAAELDRLAAA